MQNQLKIALIQSDLVWETPDVNRRNFNTKIDKIQDDSDLIILPEMFTTGFTMNAEEVAESMDGETVKWMKQKAHEKAAVIIGSLIIEEKSRFYNRFIAAFPDGEIKHFDKRHLFSFAGENEIYSQGNSKLIFTYKEFKIFPLICYDLRFPVWSRNTNNFDVLIYIANWPKARINAWDTLLKARAIENVCYTFGVNRVGVDGNNLSYSGHSAGYDFFGKTIIDFKENKESVKQVVINKNDLMDTRQKFRFLDDKDEFKIE